MFDMFAKIMGVFLSIFKIPFIVVFGFIGYYFAAVLFWYVVRWLKGDRVKRGSVRRIKPRSLFLRLFWDAPRRYVDDIYKREPDFFRPQGLIIFTGRQGNGKTSAVMQYAIELLDTYPKAKCLSNTKFAYQDEKLVHWKQLVNYKNGHKGIVVIMDELQNWFSSNQSRNFPPEMLGVITQMRKNRRVILGTAQNFYLLAKPIRSQCAEIRQCMTLAGVLTIVVRREPVIDNDGDVKELKYRGMYCFVHSDRLRDSYDTWSVVDSLSQSGFQENNPISEDRTVKINIQNPKR